MGKHGAVLLKTVKELSGRYLTARTRVDDIARNSRDYYQLLRPLFLRGPERAALPAVHGRQAQGAGHPTAG